MITKFLEEDLQQYFEEYTGFCTNCKDFTTDGCEPDARNYRCEMCDKMTVFGGEEALLSGMIGVK